MREALTAVEKELDAFVNELERAKKEKEQSVELAEAKLVGKLQKQVSVKDAEIQDLKAKLDAIAIGKELEVTKAVTAVERMRIPA